MSPFSAAVLTAQPGSELWQQSRKRQWAAWGENSGKPRCSSVGGMVHRLYSHTPGVSMIAALAEIGTVVGLSPHCLESGGGVCWGYAGHTEQPGGPGVHAARFR